MLTLENMTSLFGLILVILTIITVCRVATVLIDSGDAQ